MPPNGEASGTAAVNGGGAVEPRVEVIELWRLPLNFFELPLEEQWLALKEVTVPAKRLAGPRQPCQMAWSEQAIFALWSLLNLGLPLAIVPVTAGLYFLRPSWVKYWVGLLAVMGLHPITPYKLSYRRSRMGVIMARWFTFTMVVDRNDPMLKHMGTPGIDQLGNRNPMPVVSLACPHGVMNFGAIIWVYFNRWMCGHEQYTAGAPFMMCIPGIRYLCAMLWFVHADRKSMIKHLRERPTEKAPHGGVIGLVPDGIAGIFHCTPGHDVLHLGKKRGLMRIGYEEGLTIAAGWFPGTTDAFTVIQDPFGFLAWVSRKLKLSIFLFYGRWGLPIPRRAPTSMCPAPYKCPRKDNPTEEDLEKLHWEVYGGLSRRYDELKHYVGFGDRTLKVT